jgi:hypothetical protein
MGKTSISDDEADLGDALSSFPFASLVNALPDPFDDDDEVLNDPVSIEYVVTVESLEMTWFNTHIISDLHHVFISFLPRGV